MSQAPIIAYSPDMKQGKVQLVPRPTEKVLLADSERTHQLNIYQIQPDNTEFDSFNRHNNGANTAYFDGHVGNVSFKDACYFSTLHKMFKTYQ
jgi:prepilin-type processing-associated H-X9-DG protein